MLGNILIILSVAFTIYLSIVMINRINAVVLKDSYIKIFCYELLICAVLILLALDIRFGFFTRMEPKALKAVGWVLRVIVILLAAVFLFFIGKITIGSFIHTEAPAEHAIVLGLALENGKPTDDLLSRLDTAEQCLRDNPDATLILTGGNPDESGKTEAAAMRDILVERRVAEDKMILEDQAKTTKDNFINTAHLIDPGIPVVLITSNYHMDRAVKTAKSAGFKNILRMPAPSSFIHYGANVIWEVVLELDELIFKQ